MMLTSSLEGGAIDAAGGVICASVQLDHGVHGALITSVDTQQNALGGEISVLSGELGLLATVGREAKELGKNKEAILQCLPGLSLSLALDLGNGLSQFLLVLLGQGLLNLLLGLGQGGTPLFFQLQDLSQVLLVSGEFGFESGLVVNLSLLVGVDDFGGDELRNGLVFVLCN